MAGPYSKLPEEINPEKPIARIVPTLTDAEYAADLKSKVIEAYQPLLKLLDEANEKGFNVDIGCGLGPLGKYAIMQCRIVKIFK